MIDRVKQKTMTLMKVGEENENGRSSNMWVPFAIDAKGGEKNGESMSCCMSVAINGKGLDYWRLLIELCIVIDVSLTRNH